MLNLLLNLWALNFQWLLDKILDKILFYLIIFANQGAGCKAWTEALSKIGTCMWFKFIVRYGIAADWTDDNNVAGD